MFRSSPIDMLGRRPAPQRGGFDPEALLLDDGTLVSGADSASKAEAGLADQVRRRRDESLGLYGINRTGSDPKWDAWFGALQAKENYANANGKRMRVDLMGEGPGTGTGFGRWGAQVDGGPSVSLDGPTGKQDLAAAAAKAEQARVEQARRQAELARDPEGQKPAPYTGMFSQPDAQVAAQVEGDEVEASTAEAARRRQGARPAAAAGNPQVPRRPLVNRRQAGTYTTQR